MKDCQCFYISRLKYTASFEKAAWNSLSTQPIFKLYQPIQEQKKAIKQSLPYRLCRYLLSCPTEVFRISSYLEYVSVFYDQRCLPLFSHIQCLSGSFKNHTAHTCQNMAKYTHFSMSVLGQRQSDCVLMLHEF